MTNEEIQKTLEAILDHQGQFNVNFQPFKESLPELMLKIDRLVEAQIKAESRLSHLENSFILLTQMVQKLHAKRYSHLPKPGHEQT
jgi:hypothetical protein